MKLTPDLIANSEQIMNPCGDRTLVLRGHGIVLIENLALTRDQYACIDLCQNAITKVENIPPLPHLQTLLLSHNQIVRVSGEIIDHLPSLVSVVLSHNKIRNLSQISSLAKLPKLERLVLIGNPIATEDNYRLSMIRAMPALKFLDFQKVTRSEREQAASLESMFVEVDDEERFDNETVEPRMPVKLHLTPAISSRIRSLIENATTMQEIEELEEVLKTGVIRGELAALLGV